MKITLLKPLVFLDLETTGINISSSRIVELAMVKIMPTGEKITKRKLLNPEVTIPQEASAIHGITNEMVKDAPTFKQIAHELKQFLQGCDIGGYNSNKFDIPILIEEFLRVGLTFDLSSIALVDVQKIFHMMEQRTLTAAYKFYCGKELTDAHSALADVEATWEVFQAQLEKYPHLGVTVEAVTNYTGQEKIVDFARRFVKKQDGIYFNFGKHKDKKVEDVLKKEPQYFDWMIKGDFALDTKQKLSEMMRQMLQKN